MDSVHDSTVGPTPQTRTGLTRDVPTRVSDRSPVYLPISTPHDNTGRSVSRFLCKRLSKKLVFRLPNLEIGGQSGQNINSRPRHEHSLFL